jgi:hypothetical protein
MQDSRECYPMFIALKSVSQSTSINYKGLGCFLNKRLLQKKSITFLYYFLNNIDAKGKCGDKRKNIKSHINTDETK